MWAMVVILFYAKEAWLSGSHSIRFLETSFFYEYEEGVRKAFINGEQAERYFTSKRTRSTKVFVAALPLFSRFFNEAKQHGIKLGTLQLRRLRHNELHGEPVKSATALVSKPNERVPRLLVLDLNAGEQDSYDTNRFVVKLEEKLNQEQASWLLTRVKALRYTKLAQREAEIEAVSDEAAKRWKAGTAATRVGKNYVLCVGFTEEIRPENEAAFRAQVDALITELHPLVDKGLSDAENLKKFFTGDATRLLSIETKLEKMPQDLAPLCNPYGPLLDELGMRTAVQSGALKVTLLFASKDRWGANAGDPQLNVALTQWLEQLAAPPRPHP